MCVTKAGTVVNVASQQRTKTTAYQLIASLATTETNDMAVDSVPLVGVLVDVLLLAQIGAYPSRLCHTS